MSGTLLFVSGLTGAGKTTLVGKALDTIENLEGLLTYVTRPARQGEDNSYEYVFVNDEQYESHKRQSADWDETIFHDIKYGSDAAECNRALRRGRNVIVSVTPDLDDIDAMSRLYDVKPVTIWIDTPRAIAASRVATDSNRSSRIEDDTVKEYFDLIFTPTNDLEKDTDEFIKLVRSIVAR